MDNILLSSNQTLEDKLNRIYVHNLFLIHLFAQLRLIVSSIGPRPSPESIFYNTDPFRALVPLPSTLFVPPKVRAHSPRRGEEDTATSLVSTINVQLTSNERERN